MSLTCKAWKLFAKVMLSFIDLDWSLVGDVFRNSFQVCVAFAVESMDLPHPAQPHLIWSERNSTALKNHCKQTSSKRLVQCNIHFRSKLSWKEIDEVAQVWETTAQTHVPDTEAAAMDLRNNYRYSVDNFHSLTPKNKKH